MAIKFHWMHRNGWGNNKIDIVQMAVDLEKQNIESVLLPYGPNGLDYLLHVPNMMKVTEKIRFMMALPAYAVTPEYAARTFCTMRQFGRNRLDINLVAGNYDENQAKDILSDYPGNTDHIDTHDKRVALTEKWIEKFLNILKEKDVIPTLYVVGQSETTIRVANTFTDYLIINDSMLNHDSMSKLTNVKPLLSIDPLIIDNPEDIDNVEYHDYRYSKNNHHSIKGTHAEVVSQIRKISEDFGVKEFIVHTDQKDLSKIFKVIKELS
jgi:alkanesulfonate monooxygenase SsuD/methylene tetrahydromethanopterin reductase-like flavin-dependent oxidoreductase (luciferase family)